MTDYVKMAKEKADKRREQEAADARRTIEERESKYKQEQELMEMLKKELKQWDGIGDFTVKDLDNKSWTDCVQIDKGKERCVGFQIHWDSWESDESDDHKTTYAGYVIEMTFYMEEWHDHWQNIRRGEMKSVIKYGSNQHKIEECMKELANYLSRFL